MTAETIPQSMEAVRLHGVEDFRVEQIPTPWPGFREVLCRVEAVTICGTDIAIIQGRHQQWAKHLPMTLGHEWAGRVVALGEGAAGFGIESGDYVCGTSHSGCGYCPDVPHRSVQPLRELWSFRTGPPPVRPRHRRVLRRVHGQYPEEHPQDTRRHALRSRRQRRSRGHRAPFHQADRHPSGRNRGRAGARTGGILRVSVRLRAGGGPRDHGRLGRPPRQNWGTRRGNGELPRDRPG